MLWSLVQFRQVFKSLKSSQFDSEIKCLKPTIPDLHIQLLSEHCLVLFQPDGPKGQQQEAQEDPEPQEAKEIRG